MNFFSLDQFTSGRGRIFILYILPQSSETSIKFLSSSNTTVGQSQSIPTPFSLAPIFTIGTPEVSIRTHPSVCISTMWTSDFYTRYIISINIKTSPYLDCNQDTPLVL